MHKAFGVTKNTLPLTKKIEKHGLSDKPVYIAWRDLKQRVLNKNSRLYKDYGGRGIGICDRWRESFVAFYEDMGDRPSPKHSLDRIDVNGDYTPENCRWTTKDKQCQNKRLSSNNTTGYTGIYFLKNSPRRKKWEAKIARFHLGYYFSKEDAARAYDEAAIRLYGIHAKTNFGGQK